MKTEVWICDSTGALQWDYGFGCFGLGAYLWHWSKIILFIPEKLKSNEEDGSSAKR